MRATLIFSAQATDHGFRCSFMLPTGPVSWDSATLGELGMSLARYAGILELVTWPDGDVPGGINPAGVSSMRIMELNGQVPRYRRSIEVLPEFREPTPRVGTSWDWSRDSFSLVSAVIGLLCDLVREEVRQQARASVAGDTGGRN